MNVASKLPSVLAAARLWPADEAGQVLAEYALILALLSVVSIGVLEALGADIHVLLEHLASRMSSVTNP